MKSNDLIILDQILEQERLQKSPSLSKSEFFEIYSAAQLLKDTDLSDEEIESGIVGAGGDGGIDAIYLFADGELIREDSDPPSSKKNTTIEVDIIQCKTTSGFNEEAINKLTAVTNDLFDLSRSIDDLKTVYNESVLLSAKSFRSIYRSLASKFPTLKFKYYYVTRGDSEHVHSNVLRKVKGLNLNITRLFSAEEFSFEFVGASDLLDHARRQPTRTFHLPVSESISAQGGYVALIKLGEFAEFLRDDHGHIRKNIFDANVRDYQGSNQVNDDIQRSLANKGDENFWWLNKGITIIASKAVQSGKTLTVEDPQIVNGLQTSTEIFKFFDDSMAADDDRAVLVRIIVTGSSESNDRIIKATNSQTNIPLASLRATDKVHRDIEEYLRGFDLYYDRRKNMHKNDGRSSEKIISIPLLSQAIMAILMQRPDTARARPSSLLKRNDDYDKIFNQHHPIELYLTAGKIIKGANSYLRAREDIPAKDKNNLLFYVAMVVAAKLTASVRPTSSDLAKLAINKIGSVLEESVSIVRQHYDQLGGTDQVAKGSALLSQLQVDLQYRLRRSAGHEALQHSASRTFPTVRG